ncbi:hypothetical protein N2152v2_003825 [Parachlorella kessleri]
MEALAAKEAEQSRLELARVRLKEQRLREETMTAANAPRVRAEWIQRMRAAKLDELRNEASALAREHDAEVDRRDRLIEGLMGELRVAEDQHDAAAGAHLAVLDSLLDLQAESLQGVQARFLSDLRSIQQEFESEKAEMMSMHARQRKDSHDVVAALEAAYAEAVQEASSAYQLAHDEVKGKYTEEYNVLKLALEQKVAGLEGQIEAQHQAYTVVTKANEVAYKDLSKTDSEMSQTIASQTQRLRQLQETMAQWRGRIVHNSGEWDRQNAALAREKEAMLGHHSALKAALARFRQGQEARLRQICASSAAVQTTLRERLELAGRIFKAAELCRKLELPGDDEAALTLVPQAPGAVSAEAGGSHAWPSQPWCTAVEAPAEQLPSARRGQSSAACSPCSAPLQQCPGTGDSRPASSKAGCTVGGARLASGESRPLDEVAVEAGKPELAAFLQRLNKVYLDTAALEQQRLRLVTENAGLRAVLDKVEDGTRVTQDVLDDPLNTLMVVNHRLQNALKISPAKRGSVVAP